MAYSWRAVRRAILTPNVSATRLDVRGFHEKSPAARELLETIGATFLRGYGAAVEARSLADAQSRIEEVPARFRGFAYEGAAMGYTVLDGLPLSGRRRLPSFLAGPGKNHIYMAYVGIGWAMARLPRFRWSKLEAPDPLLQWLVLDGYGFHQAYFDTAHYVGEQFQDPAFPWPADDPGHYAGRAIDQGIGRAMWFVGGTDTDLVATMIEKFPEHRRADLYSGAGLAVTYAGGADEQELRAFWDRAGEHRAQVALGCAFAAEARLLAGLVVPHVDLATAVFCDMTPAEAARVCADQRPPDGAARPAAIRTADQSMTPAYELWRQRVAAELTSRGRC